MGVALLLAVRNKMNPLMKSTIPDRLSTEALAFISCIDWAHPPEGVREQNTIEKNKSALKKTRRPISIRTQPILFLIFWRSDD